MPETKDVHVDHVLTNIAVQYRNKNYIAQQVLPIIGVKKDSGTFYKYRKEDRFTIPKTLRAPKAEATEVDWATELDNYSLADYALLDFVADREQENADAPLRPQADTVEFLTDLLLLDYELRVANLVRDTSVLTQNITLSGTSQWNDYSNSDPLADIEAAKEACFIPPNVIIMGKPVFVKLKHHPKITERIKYSQKGIITAELLAELFEVEKVLVGKAKYNAAAPGKTPSYEYVWGKDVIVAYISPRVSIREVSLGYTFARDWGGKDGKRKIFRVRKWRNEKRGGGGWEIEVEMATDEHVIAPDVAYLIKNAVA